ncbi:centromere protein O isoform X2 [Lissotriton helveticus]
MVGFKARGCIAHFHIQEMYDIFIGFPRVLAHLEQLESMAHKLAVKQEEQKAQQRTLAEIRARIQMLRKQRDELINKLKLEEVGQFAQSTQEEANNIPIEPTHLAQKGEQATLQLKVAKMKGILEDFHLTGISGKVTARGVCICISTAYECTYLDSYYVDLTLRPYIRINHHSVPIFIPLQDIAKKHLPKNLKRFLSVLFDHLNAYAGRKYQVDKLQNNAARYRLGALQANSLCNLLSFKYEVKHEDQSFRFCAKLLYGDSVRCLPTEVDLICQDDLPVQVQQMLSTHSALFRQKGVHEVFETLCSEDSL